MALKALKSRQSKRTPAKRRYKIIKRIAEHKRKQKKLANKLPKKKSLKQKLIQVPNICPFKEEILIEVEAEKQRQEEEREKQREAAKERSAAAAAAGSNKPATLEAMVADAEAREVEHDGGLSEEEEYGNARNKDNSLRAFYKEFKKVVDAADVILEVVDARDPLGTRCEEVAQIVRNAPGNKRLVLVLNKSDLVPRENLEAWLAYFRRSGPVVPFKATTQTQKQKLGRVKFRKTKPQFRLSPCVGADILTSLLANYCRNHQIRTSIRVGVVGIPNVGKSSIINSLKRKRACSVGGVPGVTRQMQEVEIDSHIKLIDSPGVIFQRPNDENPDEFFALKNAQAVNSISDPFPLAEDILRRASTRYFCRLYDITEFHSTEEFLAKKAQKIGRFASGGVPDQRAAARSLIYDWNTGKIRYFTQPPEAPPADAVHLSAEIVTEQAREFGLDDFDATVGRIVHRIEAHVRQQRDPDKEELYMEVETKGPVQLDATRANKRRKGETKIDEEETEAMVEVESASKRKKRRAETVDADEKRFKKDPMFQLEGNQTINKKRKGDQKKLKKVKARNEKKITNVAEVLESFSLGGGAAKKKRTNDDDYDFEADFDVK